MVIEKLDNGFFANSFRRQLNSCIKNEINNQCIKFSFFLPGCKRFSYTEYSYIYNELLDAFSTYYTDGITILFIKPNPNDDHFIEVGITL